MENLINGGFIKEEEERLCCDCCGLAQLKIQELELKVKEQEVEILALNGKLLGEREESGTSKGGGASVFPAVIDHGNVSGGMAMMMKEGSEVTHWTMSFEEFLQSPKSQDIRLKLFKEVGRSEGGLAALLNCRRTSKTLKNVIEELEEEGIFASGQIHVNLREDNVVKKFLASPPTLLTLTSSLRLSGVESASMNDLVSMMRFVNFWSGQQLECLEVDRLNLTKKDSITFVDLLVSTIPTIKSLRIGKLIADPNNTDFPEFIFKLEEIEIDMDFAIARAGEEDEDGQVFQCSISADHEAYNVKLSFYSRLLASPSLKRLDWVLGVGVIGMSELLANKTEELFMRIRKGDFFSWATVNQQLIGFHDILRLFNASKIRVHIFDMKELLREDEDFWELAERWSDSIESMLINENRGWVKPSLRFPNLKELHLYFGVRWDGANFNYSMVPETVDEMVVIREEIFPMRNATLPVRPALTCITFWDLNERKTGLFELLDALDRNFPNLKTLALEGKVLEDSPDHQFEPAVVGNGTKFKHLRSLHFDMNFFNTEEEEEESRKSLHEILMNGFELQQTSLTTLRIETSGYNEDEEKAPINPPVMLDFEFVTKQLLAGNLSSTLCEVELDPQLIPREHRLCVEEYLKLLGETNQRIRRGTHGTRRGMYI